MPEETLPKDYINKEATQQAEFVKIYPEFDGRGLLIAILDTGVDLSFDGMQKTSTGLPKVIDSFDFTGAGNVDTSVVKTIGSDNVVEGLTGRLLKIPSTWKNPSGKWHLGIKSIYELCSGAALENIIFDKCIEMKVDIVNCSFACTAIKYEDQITEMTEKHGTIIIYAVGNSGPVYSSLQRRCSSMQDIFMVGSSSLKNIYNVAWHSSRGPNIFGDRGICFIAPGEAILSTPECYGQKPQLHGGTSFAAPNAAGSIACLLSALKNNAIEYSPPIIKFALSKSTRLPESGNELSYGHGIIQILAAFKFLKSSDFSKLFQSCNQRIKISNEDKTGIFVKLDGKGQKNIKEKYTVEILNQSNPTENVELQLTKKAQKFIRCSDAKSGSFNVELNLKSFKPGTISYAEINGINTEHSGSTFYLPITVIKPTKVIKEDNYRIQKDITLNLDKPYRLFLLPPEKSHQCAVKITALEEEIPTIVHINHAIEDLEVDHTKAKWLTFKKLTKTQSHFIKVMPKRIHEIFFRLASADANLQSAKFKIEIDFYGILQKVPKVDENKNNVLTISNTLKPLTAGLALNFKKISYNFLPENVSAETVLHSYDSEKTDYLKLIYFFTLTKETKCSFQMNHEKEFPILRAQVFTESKKFIHGFYSTFEDVLTLLPGKYSIIAYAFSSPPSSDINNNNYIPPTGELPFITLTMELHEPFTSQINNISSKTNESKNYNKIEIREYQINLPKIPDEKFQNPLPSDITLHGFLNVNNENLNMNISIQQQYTFYSNNNDQKVISDLSFDIEEWPSLTQSFKEISITPKNPKKNALNFKLAAAKLPVKNPIPKNLNKIQKDLIQACRDFLQISNSHGKEINQIENAIASGHFGIALMQMNDLSTKNQTNPYFKLIDLAIIKLLKHLKWNHLVEAHQNALLDRHRDYHRLL